MLVGPRHDSVLTLLSRGSAPEMDRCTLPQAAREPLAGTFSLRSRHLRLVSQAPSALCRTIVAPLKRDWWVPYYP